MALAYSRLEAAGHPATRVATTAAVSLDKVGGTASRFPASRWKPRPKLPASTSASCFNRWPSRPRRIARLSKLFLSGLEITHHAAAARAGHPAPLTPSFPACRLLHASAPGGRGLAPWPGRRPHRGRGGIAPRPPASAIRHADRAGRAIGLGRGSRICGGGSRAHGAEAGVLPCPAAVPAKQPRLREWPNQHRAAQRVELPGGWPAVADCGRWSCRSRCPDRRRCGPA